MLFSSSRFFILFLLMEQKTFSFSIFHSPPYLFTFLFFFLPYLFHDFFSLFIHPFFLHLFIRNKFSPMYLSLSPRFIFLSTFFFSLINFIISFPQFLLFSFRKKTIFFQYFELFSPYLFTFFVFFPSSLSFSPVLHHTMIKYI